jgi:putative ABC transport system ATP-binding protein
VFDMTITLDHLTIPYLGVRESAVLGQLVVFEPATAIAVIAPSGSGKTSLLKALYGLATEFSGDICFDGRSVRALTGDDWAALRRDQLSVVFQDLRLFPELTLRENVVINSQLAAAVAVDLDEMADTIGLSGRLDEPAIHLSLGEQQRVSLLRALAQPFRWLLLDEPFSHVEPTMATRMAALIKSRCSAQDAGCVVTALQADPPFPVDSTLTL